MKAHGKGKPLDLQPNANSISQLNQPLYLANVSEDVPILKFQPLTSWPARPHPQQARIDEFRALGSPGTVDAIARDK